MSYKRNYQSARDVMDQKLVFIEGIATAKEAVEVMRKEQVNALIVKKRHPQDAFGIVTIHDLIKGVIIPDRNSEDVNIFEIMTKPVVSIPADMDIRYVARLLQQIDLRLAPVESNGEYIGMISLSKIILDNMLF